MIEELFSLKNFNVVEDDNYYYVFRALNRADHNDIKNHLTDGVIRTDRERYEEEHGEAKYNKDSEISLEEIWDHIKMRYLKETNCISLSTNANVSLDYGSCYFDEYAMIRIPKNKASEYYPAGQYMLEEVNKEVNKVINEEKIPDDIQKLLNLIDKSISNNEIINIINYYSITAHKDRSVISRFQDRQYFNDKQQLEYNRIIA